MKNSLIITILAAFLIAGGLIYFTRPDSQLKPPSAPDEASPAPQTITEEPQPANETPAEEQPSSTPEPEFELEPSPTPHPEIRLESPQHGDQISSPLTVTGEARGTWFFEGSFPVVLTDWDGEIISEGLAFTQEEWMTEEFIPFEAELEFKKPELYERGHLILQKDNPSGMRDLDDAFEITVFFE